MRNMKGKKGFMAIKIDLEKAYDRVRWDFIMSCLEELQIPNSLIEVVKACISSPSMQILWEGSRAEEFSPTRGIRQGDPISPYLFVICMEKLAHIIQHKISTKRWKPIRLGKNGPPITHLFFADDLLLFAEANMDQVETIKDCLDKFCNASGHKVSANKTRVFFSKNVNHNRARQMSEELGFQITGNLGKYLGVPLHHDRVTTETFQHLVDKVKDRLSSWHASRISLAGRDTLVKSVIAAMPSYNMQTTNLPASVCENIEKKARNFLWGSSDERRRMHLVAWDKVCTEKTKGGLGMKHIRQQNRAYMMKLGWGLIKERDSLWAKVIRSKYGCGDDLIPRINSKKPGSNTWSGIKHNWPKVQEGIQLITDRDGIERARWKFEKHGSFTVRSAYKVLSHEEVSLEGRWSDVWKLKIPQRCKLFAWLMLHGRLITNSLKQRMSLHPNGRCDRCQEFIEDEIHAIRDCKDIRNIWEKVIHPSVYDRFFSGNIHTWFQANMRHSYGLDMEQWKYLFVIICWLIWRDRNERIHSCPTTDLSQINAKAKAILGSFMEAMNRIKYTKLANNQVQVEGSTFHNVESYTTVEVDGAYSPCQGKCACGGIIIDCNGTILEGFRLKLENGESLEAEIWGCLLGLKRAWEGGHRLVRLRSDSQEVIHLLLNDISDLHEDWSLIMEVKEMLRRDWVVMIEYIERNLNARADLIAKTALNDYPGLTIMGPDTLASVMQLS